MVYYTCNRPECFLGDAMNLRRTEWAALLLAFLAACPSETRAFAAGAPICEVSSLPLMEMSPVLADPAPSGWSVRSARAAHVFGQPLRLRVHHENPGKRLRGVLIWAKSGPSTGAGQFALPDGGMYQFIPAPAECGEWALSHSSPNPKTQSELQFQWLPPAGGTAIVRAFLIEDCGLPQGCRAHQALTPVLVLPEAVFIGDFEAD